MSMTFATDVVVNNGFKINNGRFFYGQCDTAASTVAKVVTCANFTANDLVKGAVIFVLFTVTNSGAVADITMDVNSTGAKPIKCFRNGAVVTLPGAGYLLANQTYLFCYDGTNWVTIMDYDSDTNDAVKQTATTTNATYEILFSETADNTTRTEGARKTSTLTYNPSTKLFTNSGSFSSNGKDVFFGTYSASSTPASPVAGQLWFKDAPMSLVEAMPYKVQTTASSLPVTITDSNITSDMEVIRSDIGVPNVQNGDIIVTTSDGSLTISGTITGSTSITLWFCRCR